MRKIFGFHKSNSGEIARSRLKLLLVSDQVHCSPGLIEMIRDDMVSVLSRYAEFDTGQVEICMTRIEQGKTGRMMPALSAQVPIRGLNYMRNE